MLYNYFLPVPSYARFTADWDSKLKRERSLLTRNLLKRALNDTSKLFPYLKSLLRTKPTDSGKSSRTAKGVSFRLNPAAKMLSVFQSGKLADICLFLSGWNFPKLRDLSRLEVSRRLRKWRVDHYIEPIFRAVMFVYWKRSETVFRARATALFPFSVLSRLRTSIDCLEIV